MLSACKRIINVAILTVGVMAGAVGSAQAALIYVDDANNMLGVVDTTNKTVSTPITIYGTDPGDGISDIAFSSSGVLYGVAYNTTTDKSALYTINLNPGPYLGLATKLGTIKVGSTDVLDVNALTFGPDGTLYAASAMSRDIYSLDLTTGNATDLGTDGFQSSGDLAFNNGNLYLSALTNGDVNNPNSLIKISLNGTTVSGGTNLGSMGFNDVHGLATGSDGILYGASDTEMISINTATGTGTPVFNYSGDGLGDARGATALPEAAPAPEPGSMALLLSGSLVLGLGYWRRQVGLRLA